MAKYEIPVMKQVPAQGSVEVEAESFESACTKVQREIEEQGFLSPAGEAEFTADWENAWGLSLDEARFPERKG